MVCEKCKKQYKKGQTVCADCGGALTKNSGNQTKTKGSKSEVRRKLVEDKFISAFSDNSFMIVCILTTISAVISSVSGFVDIIGILFAIFMWLTYSVAKKGVIYSKYMRFTSGMVYTIKIMFWFGFGVYVLIAIFSLAVPSLTASTFHNTFNYYNSLFEFLAVDIGIIMFLVYIIYAVVFALTNILFYNPAHKLAKSMYKSVDVGELNLEHFSKTKNCALFMAVVKILMALVSHGGIKSIASAVCLCAAYIIIHFWLNKYFGTEYVNYNEN